MLSALTTQEIVLECRAFCERFRLDQVYLAEVVGPRRHYLGGYGRPSLDKAEQLPLSGKIMLFWHGSPSPGAQEDCKKHFSSLAERIERELASCDPPQQAHAASHEQIGKD